MVAAPPNGWAASEAWTLWRRTVLPPHPECRTSWGLPSVTSMTRALNDPRLDRGVAARCRKQEPDQNECDAARVQGNETNSGRLVDTV